MPHCNVLPMLEKCTAHFRAFTEHEGAATSAETKFTRENTASSGSARRLINIWRYTGETNLPFALTSLSTVRFISTIKLKVRHRRRSSASYDHFNGAMDRDDGRGMFVFVYARALSVSLKSCCHVRPSTASERGTSPRQEATHTQHFHSRTPHCQHIAEATTSKLPFGRRISMGLINPLKGGSLFRPNHVAPDSHSTWSAPHAHGGIHSQHAITLVHCPVQILSIKLTKLLQGTGITRRLAFGPWEDTSKSSFVRRWWPLAVKVAKRRIPTLHKSHFTDRRRYDHIRASRTDLRCVAKRRSTGGEVGQAIWLGCKQRNS